MSPFKSYVDNNFQQIMRFLSTLPTHLGGGEEEWEAKGLDKSPRQRRRGREIFERRGIMRAEITETN
jgi:hypothetical protein